MWCSQNFFSILLDEMSKIEPEQQKVKRAIELTDV